jgi:competence protein ComFC
MTSGIRTVADAVISVLFPAPCNICGEVLGTASLLPICESCFAALEPLRGPFCEHCGRPFPSEVALDAKVPQCFACRRGLYAFDAARSYGAYTDQMVRAIGLLKYQKLTRLGAWFANRLNTTVEEHPILRDADVIVPVPLHPARRRERGYNQAEVIAKPLARLLKLPLGAYLLVRTKPRPERLLLSRRDRWLTVRGAYEIRKGTRIDNLRVLLIDDVFTTGATLDACAQALKKAGAKSVMGLTVARAIWRGSPPAEKLNQKSQTRPTQPASKE